jgi:quercetin dioxygenase-like cupin family protein
MPFDLLTDLPDCVAKSSRSTEKEKEGINMRRILAWLKSYNLFAHALFTCLVAAGVICAFHFRAQATPPSNIAFTAIGRATVPEFRVKRKEKALDWEIRLEAEQPIDVATQIVTFQPGGFSGWHTHPGPVLFTVRTGTLTVYEGTDPTCTPHSFTAGTGMVEAATNDHIHMVRNETSSVAEAVVTYLVPVGANPLRTDLPNPGNCPF